MMQLRWPQSAQWALARESFADALVEYHDIKAEGLGEDEAVDALDPPNSVLDSLALSVWWALQRLWVVDPAVVLLGGAVGTLFLVGAALRLVSA